MAPKRTFGHARRGGQPVKPNETPSKVSLESLSEEEYARLVEPLRQAPAEPEGGGGLVALFTTSSYRYWLWFGLGIAVLLLVQAVGFGDDLLSGLSRQGEELAARGGAEGVEITELVFDTSVGEGGSIGISGGLRNGGEGTVTGLTVALAFHDCPDGYSAGLEECTHHDDVLVEAIAEVPSGEAGPFQGSVSVDALPPIEGTLEVTYQVEGVTFE